MNLKSEIRPDLWSAIEKAYESGLFKNAILNGFHFLSDILRERANVDGDGANLVGQALGGETPRLKVNKFQTESERNEQKGLEQILRGLYIGFRNPRSHSQNEDTQTTADSILLFLNHIIGIVSIAKRPFSVEEWSTLVVDKDFVPNQKYVDLLLQEVPINLYNEVLINLFRKKSQGEGSNLNLIFHTMIEKLGIENAGDFMEVVSEFLRTVQNDLEVKTILEFLPPIAWRHLNGVARLRIENKLIKAIDIGQYTPPTDECIHGWLGTWARDFVIYFELKENLFNALLRKLREGNAEADYVAKYFMSQLPNTIENTNPRTKTQTAQYVRALAYASFSDTSGSDFVRMQLHQLPRSWINLIKTEAGKLEDLNQEAFGKFVLEEDDLPF